MYTCNGGGGASCFSLGGGVANGEGLLEIVLNSEEDHDPCSVGLEAMWDELFDVDVDSAPAGGFRTDAPHNAHATWVLLWFVLPGIV